jgi:hypothetical protein
MKTPTFVKRIAHNLLLIPGIRTKQKIVVIESDDWGSIRMPSREVYESLLKKGIRVDQFPFNRYDSLASEEDLTALFEVLTSVKDKNGNPAVMTVNTIVTNPDFEKIKETGYQEYYYEPFTETLKRYPKHTRSFELWKEAMNAGIFRPQFHGREHLNVYRWMKALRENTGNARLAFDFRTNDLSVSDEITEDSFVDTFNFENQQELEFQMKAIVEGTRLFKTLFGYRSKTFIAPCYIWSSRINHTLKQCGIESMQGIWLQFEPQTGKRNQFKSTLHYFGQKNKLGQHYLIRNASFEPFENKGRDYVDDTLARIHTAFMYGKPAIIGSHRLNYIGFIDPSNRDRNLPELRRLLKKIPQLWPDIEFMSSDQLVDFMYKKEE